MKIKHVTLTGADEAVDPLHLYLLACRYPWVEWGILFAPGKTSKPRYPSLVWITKLLRYQEEGMQLSAHFCGKYVEDAINAGYVLEHIRKLYSTQEHLQSWFTTSFNRFQLNMSWKRLRQALSAGPIKSDRPLIFGGNYSGVETFDTYDDTVFPLFDKSGGRGKSPKAWPKPFAREGKAMLCGYAGGLGPENITEELRKIEEVVGDATIWIDMESGVRTDDKFDLDKCEAVLRAAEPWTIR